MELDDFKSAWQTLDARLSRQDRLQLELLRERKLDNARRGLRSLVFGQSLQVLLGVGITVLLLRARVFGPLTSAIGIGLTAVWALSFLGGPFAPALADGPVGTAGFAAYAVWFFWLGAVGIVLLRSARTPAGVR